MKSKKVIAAALALLLAALSGACRTTEPEWKWDGSSDPAAVSGPEQQEVFVNPLTGEEGYAEEKLMNRPAAVMVNNIQQALPQRGISKADFIYEMPVEGGITRLMAVFADYHDLPEIGSIRSARHDYAELLLPLDAVYLHFGGSEAAKQAIETYGIDDIDGLSYANTAFYFDETRARKKAREHCFFSDAKLLQAGIDKAEIRTKLSTPLEPVFPFDKKAEQSMTEQALSVTVPMSGACTATFTYDEAAGRYRKGQFGGDHIDETTGKAVFVQNVFLMYTDVSLMADGLHKEIDLSKGHGYYFTGGKMRKVTFKKADASSGMQVFAEDGSECAVMPGNSWFCVIPGEFEQRLSITGGGAE